jgi:hypothetical protein
VELTRRQEEIIDEAKAAMRRTLVAAYPDPSDHGMLYLATITGAFAALCAAGLAPQLLAVVNSELRPANLQISRRTGVGAPGHPLTRKRA